MGSPHLPDQVINAKALASFQPDPYDTDVLVLARESTRLDYWRVFSMSLTGDDHAVLADVVSSVFIPASTDTSLDELLADHPNIEQRTSIFFDETLRLLVCLDFPPCSEDRLQSYLRLLELRVDVWATSSRDSDNRSPADENSSRERLASKSVTQLEDPVSVIRHADDDETNVRLLLAWETQIAIGRPRVRSSDQSIIFQPIATVANAEVHEDDEYLEPFTASEPNLLGSIPGLGSEQSPYFPASRLEKVPFPAPKTGEKTALKNAASRSFRAYAAFMPRLKYFRIATQRSQCTTIASLDIEMIPFLDLSGIIKSIEVTMGSGEVVPLMPDFLPMQCKSKSYISFLYKLLSAHQSGIPNPVEPNGEADVLAETSGNLEVLSIEILMHLEIGRDSKVQITTSWTTNVDFSQALNPAFGAPSQTLQRTNRPTSLNFAPYPSPSRTNGKDRPSTTNAQKASASLQHHILPTAIPLQPKTAILSISFIAPDEPAHVGVPFSWRVLIVNNSARVAKLAIVPLPRIQRPTNAAQNFAKRHAPKASNTAVAGGSFPTRPQTSDGSSRMHVRNAKSGSFAKAVVDEHVIYALHHQAPSAGAAAVPPEADLISLTAELRIGPLGIKQCHETEIEFVAYRKGVFAIDAIRVVDLTKDTEAGVSAINDIRELPEVVVVDDHDDESA